MKKKYSFIKILTGSDLSKKRLPVMEIKSSNPGPAVWLTSCVHGDAVGGVAIIQEIFKKLDKSGLKKGTVYAFPLMNPSGFETASRHIMLSEEDLNRAFPGNKNGSLAERIADKIFSEIIKTKPSLVLDLHNDWRQTAHYTIIDNRSAFRSKSVYKKVKFFSRKSGIIVVGEQKEAVEKEETDKSLTYNLVQKNIPALTLELGESYIVNEEDVTRGIRTIWGILSTIGMVEPIKDRIKQPLPKIIKNKILKYSNKPVSSTSGVIRFLVKPGDVVKKGQPVARIYNAFGKLNETVNSESLSVVLGLSDTSVAYP
ncbi:succinylglutamate desuccinylase/aspartoacylase family protein, partial [Candidatus Woesearchaeota archaeon]|nr:succinylglutamate desuccinylase/aspartoacylase family protein [Candidatus Woesearchaeota archaeon]